MFTRHFSNRRIRNLASLVAVFAWAGAINIAAAVAPTAPNDPPDLGPTPPDLTQSVDPNIVVTFDDSGSMASTFMGDNSPYNNGTWNAPWSCANVIDPRSTALTNPISRSMNGVYYNPNISYTPPLYEDGTAFPNADATLTAVWEDGVAVNRPLGPAAAGGAGFNDNPTGSATANSGAVTNLMGQFTTTGTPTAHETNSLPHNDGRTLVTSGCPADVLSDPNYVAGSCLVTSDCSNGGTRCYWNYQLNVITTTDHRWRCGSATWGAARATQNPFDGTVADPDTGATPNGGPVYYRLMNTVTFTAGTDTGALGQFTGAGLAKLYATANWEAVSVPPAQYQNFANWYAYYRYRNLMARSAMSRVFGVIGTPTSSNVRVAWQNLNNGTYLLPGSTIITNLDDNSGTGCNLTSPSTVFSASTAPTCYRGAFFNWIYQVPASNSTPSRSAAIRAGNFFKRGNTSDLKDPYWQAGSGAQPGQELACRQNFHMLMTDGLYNQPAVSVSGNGSTTASGQNLPGAPVEFATDPATYAVGTGATPTTIYKGFATDSDGGSTYSDISFYYWANNLRPDLITSHPTDRVPAYFPDQKTGVTGAVAIVDPADPGATQEVFWNPLNDPATWPHVVQFAVTLGAFGTLNYSTDMDCNVDSGFGVGNDDLCKLRTGLATSSGVTGWPRPNGAGGGIAANIDDLWHAALNSRGAFFVATDPSSLVQHLADIINSILARTQSSTAESVSTSILNQGTLAYSGGYDSGAWSGYLYNLTLDSITAVATQANWDAGCLLTGGTFNPIPPTSSTPPRGSCAVPTPPPVAPARIIFTSTTALTGTGLSGVPFEWATLGTNEQGYLDLDPNTVDPNGSTGLVTGTIDGNGSNRVDYLRGKRDNETTPTSGSGVTPTQFRIRTSLLGPIINSQAIYEAGPSSGLNDLFPAGSPEQVAAAPCTAGLTASGCNSYEKFVKDNINRTPLIYVGANDGMLHAFDAASGVEQWAYVPNMLYRNGQLDQYTNSKNTLTTTVDDTPILQDMFLSGSWHTILVGSMRLGGRGIYVLDITDQSTPGSESAAAGKFKWEFTNADDADLGYTYASTNTARLANGKWVVLLTSGYYPQKLQERSATFGLNGTPDTAPGATANVTHLWVLDADTGAVIRKIDSKGGIISYGLSTPNVVDFGLDLIGDASVVGDLAGNLWRFDLSNPSPSSWSVDQLFQTYTSTSACSTGNTSGIGCEPISVQPEAFPDPVTGSVIYVFGSGEYLGPTDRTSSSVIGTNHFFGVRDYGAGSAKYPLHETDLVTQTLTQNGTNQRLLTTNGVPATKAGWMIPLDVSGVLGERDVVKATPLFAAGIAVLTSLIPGANNDPCNPGRLGAVIAVNAATGGPALVPPGTAAGTPVVAGAEVINPPAVGSSVVLSPIGGGSVIIPGVGIVGGAISSFTINGLPIWRRTSWRELLDNL